MIKVRNILTTLIASSMAMVMVFGTGITAHAEGDWYADGRSSGMTPGGVIIYGCYYDDGQYMENFPVEYLLAIDAAGITNEMSDYEKCVRINNYLCAVADPGYPDVPPRESATIDDATIEKKFNEAETTEDFFAFMNEMMDTYHAVVPIGHKGLDLLQYGKGVCQAYSDAFQTMTSMLGIESYIYGSGILDHGWNAVVIDGVTYFIDVTWNDQQTAECSNLYLMSTELWDNHKAADIAIRGTTYGEWERTAAERKQARDEIMAELAPVSEILNDPMLMWDDDVWSEMTNMASQYNASQR